MQTFDGPIEGVSLHSELSLMILIGQKCAKVFEASPRYDKGDSFEDFCKILIEATTAAVLCLLNAPELLELKNEFLQRELAVFILREELLEYLSDVLLSDVFAFKEQEDMEKVPGRELVDLELSDLRERLRESLLDGRILLNNGLAHVSEDKIFVTHLKCLGFNVEAELVSVDSCDSR